MARTAAAPSRQQGLTLVELTVALLILAMLTSVAVRSGADLQNQARYEQTRERLDMIREAILGDPRPAMNGQRAISGFVADLGRLPGSLRELLERGTNPPWATGICSLPGPVTEQACVAKSGAWTPNPANLGMGWRGPYLRSSKNPADGDAFTDGWGREAQGLCSDPSITTEGACTGSAVWTPAGADYNYGWWVGPWTDPATGAPGLAALSYGADQQWGGAGYEADFPAGLRPLVEPDDWLVRIDGGLTATFAPPRAHAPPPGACSRNDPDNNLYYTNRQACQGAAGTWHSCSDKTSATRSACELGGHVWFGEGYGCKTDFTKTNAGSCQPTNWVSCSDGSAAADAGSCPEKFYGQGYGCGDPTKSDKAACTAAGKTWYEDWSGCSNDARKYHRLHPVSACSGSWIYNRGAWLHDDQAGNPAKVRLCLRLHSRAGTFVSTNTVYARENGEHQILVFGSFEDGSGNPSAFVPAGENAVGLFEYDAGTERCTANPYPEDRKVIPMAFHARATPAVLPW